MVQHSSINKAIDTKNALDHDVIESMMMTPEVTHTHILVAEPRELIAAMSMQTIHLPQCWLQGWVGNLHKGTYNALKGTLTPPFKEPLCIAPTSTPIVPLKGPIGFYDRVFFKGSYRG